MAITLQAPPGQPLDADLTAIAGLTSAADKGIQFTGAGTAGLFDLTTAGKALLDDADATAQRVTLGLAIGTNVQAFSATLATLASSTAAGLALMDDADATAQRATLGLVIGTNVQAFDADLSDIAAIADVQGDIMVRGAAGWERLAKSATATHVLTAGATQPAWAAPSGGGSVATDAIWNAAGDLAVGTGPDTAAVLSPGTALQTLRVNAGATALEWATPGAPGADSVTNAILANVPTATIKGRITAGTGDPEDLTQAQARTVLALTPGTDVQAFSSVLAATTASFLTADETKLDGIEALADVTDAANVNAAGAVMESDYDANTVLAATTDNTPLPITMGASTILARLASGNIIASTPSQLRTLLALVPGTDVQAFDADLAAIAGLTSAADKGIQFTGVGTASTYDLTTAGKALLDDANNTAQRVTLGLVIGTDVQAQDAELSAIAGLTSAADRLPYFTGLGTAALATFTAAGRAIVDDADATAQRVTLGLVIGTNVQAFSSTLSTLASSTAAGLALMDDADATAQRTTLGLGTIATQAASSVAITGGAISATALTLKAGTAPTAEGLIEWNTTNNTILVGDGAGTKTFGSDQLEAGVRTVIDATNPGFLSTDVVLSGGVAGGDTLMGGTGSGENLILQSTDHATQGSVFLMGEDVTYTATPAPLFGVSSARTTTANYASQRMPIGIDFSSTRVMTTAGNSGTLPNSGFKWAVTYKNANGVAAHLAPSTIGASTRAFADASINQADGATVNLGVHSSFHSGPTIQGINSGVLGTASTYAGFTAAPTVTDATLINSYGLLINNPTLSGTGAITNVRGIDILALTSGTTMNVGIRNAAHLRQVSLAAFGADTAPTYGIHMMATTGDPGSLHFAEVTTTPTNPASSAGVVMYHKADKLVIAFNHAGTMRYATYDLTQTATAVWATSTSAP